MQSPTFTFFKRGNRKIVNCMKFELNSAFTAQIQITFGIVEEKNSPYLREKLLRLTETKLYMLKYTYMLYSNVALRTRFKGGEYIRIKSVP